MTRHTIFSLLLSQTRPIVSQITLYGNAQEYITVGLEIFHVIGYNKC